MKISRFVLHEPGLKQKKNIIRQWPYLEISIAQYVIKSVLLKTSDHIYGERYNKSIIEEGEDSVK